MKTETTQQNSKKSTRYDRRLIRQIVQEVEDGVPRKEIMSIYHCSYASLDNWMYKFGSEYYKTHVKKKSFSSLQKRSIVSAIAQKRMSIDEALVQYGIQSKSTIRSWISAEQKELVDICAITNLPMAKKKLPDTDTEVAALRKALEESQLKNKALNTMIDIAEQELKINIRKKSGAKQS